MTRIHVDESKSFENTLDEVYLIHHYHQTNIPPGMHKLSEQERIEIAVGTSTAKNSKNGSHDVNGVPVAMKQNEYYINNVNSPGRLNGKAVVVGFLLGAIFLVFICNIIGV